MSAGFDLPPGALNVTRAVFGVRQEMKNRSIVPKVYWA
jgi:hypothetical protein